MLTLLPLYLFSNLLHVRTQIKSLLHDYLATDGAGYGGGSAGERGGNVFQRSQRDRQKVCMTLWY